LYDQDSTYTVELIAYSPANCSDTVKHQVTAFRIPIVDFSAAPVSQMYPNATINIENLSNSGYDNYHWDFDDGTTRLDTEFTHPAPYTYDTWGVYNVKLHVEAGDCDADANQTVTILAPEPASSSVDGMNKTGCVDLTADFGNVRVSYADTYAWDFGDGGTSTDANPIYIYDVAGIYTVTLVATGEGGTKTFTGTVDAYPMPIVDFAVAPDTVMLPNQPIHCYNNSTFGDTYQWEFGDAAIDTAVSPIHYYNAVGEYFVKLKVWTEYMCLDSMILDKPVIVEPAGKVVFPNAFTPSISGATGGRWQPGDFSNDIFHPLFRGVLEYKLEVFNRWGEKVFESDNPMIGWDGYIDGKIAPQDVYVWKLSGRYRNGVPFKDSGDITLLR